MEESERDGHEGEGNGEDVVDSVVLEAIDLAKLAAR